MGLAQIHVTCEYFVFQEFKRILYITLAKYMGQKSIAGLFSSRSLYTQPFRVLNKSDDI